MTANTVRLSDVSDETEKFSVTVEGPEASNWDAFETENEQEAIDEADAIAAEIGAKVVRD